MLLIDSHAHMDDKAFEADRPEVLRRAREAGVAAVVTIGVADSPAGIEAAVRLAETIPDEPDMPVLFATVGVHPHDARRLEPAWYDRLAELARRPKVVGIGEIGLDYHYMHSPKDVQRKVFEGQLDLARRLGLPVVIHSREAEEETLAILEAAAREAEGGRLRGVVHCFSGSEAMARRVLDLGLHLSFTGVVTFPKAETLREIARKVPLERLLVETDCPYLAPVPYRGKRNEPARVVHVAEALAATFGRPVEEIAEATTHNAVDLFRLEGVPGHD